MNTIHKKIASLSLLFFALSCASPTGNENTIISIQTTLGDIKVRLYDETPVHRDNFIKLVKSGFYDGISFHRVINKFMIQAGDPLTKEAKDNPLSDTLKSYTLPAEINNLFFHKKGALAAARQGNDVNPEMRSSGTQFYIVQGETYTDEELDLSEKKINNNLKQSLFNTIMQQTADSVRTSGGTASDAAIQELASIKMFQYLSSNNDIKFTEDQRNAYKTIGGTPRLDESYTVFGEVTEGLDIVDRIAGVQTDTRDRPVTDIKIIKMKIVKK